MMQNAISACVVANSRELGNQATLSADQLGFDSFSRRANFTHLPCALCTKQAVGVVQFLAVRRSKLKPRTLASALPNRDGEPKASFLHSSADGQPLLALGNNKSCKDADAEEDPSARYSRSDFSVNANHMVNRGELLDKLKAVHLHVLASEQWNASQIKLCHRNYLVSATNLIHYLALKCLDIEQVKEDFSSIGLLSWEIIDSCVMASLSAGIQLLEELSPNSLNARENISGNCTEKRLENQRNEKFAVHLMRKKAYSNRELLMGPLQDGKTSHVMVTVGKEATENEMLITDLIDTGASIIRINCAHGDPSVWSEIIRRVKRSSQMLEKPCQILMDLGGPKLRTAGLKPGPHVMKISPERNASGNVIFPAQVWLSHKGAGPPPNHVSPDAVVVLSNPDFLCDTEVGDTVRFKDARRTKRILKIVGKFHVFGGIGFIAECSRTSYIESGTQLYIKGKKGRFRFAHAVDVPAVEPSIRLRVGDSLVISRDSSCSRIDLPEAIRGTHRITCSSGLLFDSVKPGEPIAFDDGKIWGIIQGTSISEIIVSITHANPRGTKLRPEKSINIPESNIQFQGLTSKDLMDLEFVSTHADMVGFSFVRDVNDITMLCLELEKRKLWNLGIILKIETRSGFENLPQMLLEAMKLPNPLGVMIARGDLAVECGWERIAAIQEVILSICSAAHVPVIWATQVLESFVKSGVPSRAEITDVANGRR
ncbi:plastidial pyruvate kinase 4, chloroplastic isoform X2 [Morus notabilis]|nr:plastidial pyruvate kinase 4, chloroplastic isoform X2 [Morus notabilis]